MQNIYSECVVTKQLSGKFKSEVIFEYPIPFLCLCVDLGSFSFFLQRVAHLEVIILY